MKSSSTSSFESLLQCVVARRLRLMSNPLVYPDDKVLVYIGYPSEVVGEPPSWVDSLLAAEQKNKESSPFRFYLSGGSITEEAFTLLKGRGPISRTALSMSMKLAQGHTSRLVDPLRSPGIEKLATLAQESPL